MTEIQKDMIHGKTLQIREPDYWLNQAKLFIKELEKEEERKQRKDKRKKVKKQSNQAKTWNSEASISRALPTKPMKETQKDAMHSKTSQSGEPVVWFNDVEFNEPGKQEEPLAKTRKDKLKQAEKQSTHAKSGKAKSSKRTTITNSISVSVTPPEEEAKATGEFKEEQSEESDDATTEARWLKYDNARLDESDDERFQSVEQGPVPAYPIFVNVWKACPKLRRVRTDMQGLFVYTGHSCSYWPTPDEIPTELPEGVREELNELFEDEDEADRQRIFNMYGKYYKVFHIYGKFRIAAKDEEDLKQNFEERLHQLIYNLCARYFYAYDFNHGYGKRWMREMIGSVKYQHIGSRRLVLSGHKLAKKPFIEIKYNAKLDAPIRKSGSWKDEPESDNESRQSPPRYK